MLPNTASAATRLPAMHATVPNPGHVESPNQVEIGNPDILGECEEVRIPQALLDAAHCASVPAGEF
jgi:hypothetical protein